MMAFQDAPKEFYGFSFIPGVGFSFPSAECVWLLAADCCCKTCRRELGRHFLSHVDDLPWQPLAVGRGPLWGGGERSGGGKNGEVERLTSQQESLKMADRRQRGRNLKNKK